MKWSIPLCLLMAAFLPSALEAQGLQNAITGQIRDMSGAAIANATVTVTNVATNVSTTVKTGESGTYSVLSLVVGEYEVKAERSGLQTTVRRGVVLQANRSLTVDFELQLGRVSQTVEVTSSASAVLMRTEDPATGLVISKTQVENLPLKGRNFLSLAQIAPGANEAAAGNQNSLGRTQSLNLSANGQRMFDNNYRLDGVSLINGFVNGSTFVPSLEALQEVSVQTGQYSAALGTFSGAQVDMVVKSGTNQLHGSAFEFFRNNDLNARQFFDVGVPPPFHFNQFGLSVGGPVILPKIYNGRNKTFFFFAYQGDRTRQQSTGQGTAATAAMRSGDLSAFLPATIKDPYTGRAFAGNIIPANRIAPQALKLLQYVPLPDRPGLSLNYINTASSVDDESQYFGRIDEKIGDKDALFFRIGLRDAYLKSVTINPLFGSFSYPTNQDYVLTETHIFSPNIVNEARLFYVRESTPSRTGREGANIDPLRDFGIGGLNFSDPLIVGIPSASISGYLGTGENFSNPRLLFSNPGFQESMFIQRGRHALHLGADYSRWRLDSYAVNATNQGQFNFTGQLSGNAFSDFLLGLPFSTTKTDFLGEVSLHQKHASAYIQDDWRLRPNLTINLGMRYELAGSLTDLLGNARNFNWSTLNLFPDPGATAPLNNTANNIAPRTGFAYSINKTGTVVRGGFGLFFTQPTMANATLLYRNPPRNLSNTYTTNLAAPNLTLANGFLNSQLGNNTTPASLVSIPQDYGPGYEEMWNFNVQQKLPANFVAEVGYVGSHTLHLDSAHTENTPPPGPGAVQARRPLPQWGDIRVFGTDGVSYYQALQTRIQSADWRGLNLLGSYTYSKCIDTKSSTSTSTVGVDDAEPQNQNDRIRGERGLCAINFPQQFHLHAVYELPFGKNAHGLLRALVGGYQVSAGITMHSGPPFTIIEAGNTANTSRGTIRPNRIRDGNLPSQLRTPGAWFDSTAFTAAPAFTFGNSGRGIIEAPGAKTLDLSVVKRFAIFERHTLELRGDAFNATNTTQFGIPGRTLGNPDFGKISTTYPARNLQLAIRYAF